jgi:hypothetical protein
VEEQIRDGADLLSALSQEIADINDTEILDYIKETRLAENLGIMESTFPGADPEETLRRLGVEDVDLAVEGRLREKLRNARIKSALFG